MASFFTIFLKSFGSILKMFVLEGIMLESSTLRHFEALDCGNNFYSQSSGKLSPPPFIFTLRPRDCKVGQSSAFSFPQLQGVSKAALLSKGFFFPQKEIVKSFVIVHTAFYFSLILLSEHIPRQQFFKAHVTTLTTTTIKESILVEISISICLLKSQKLVRPAEET